MTRGLSSHRRTQLQGGGAAYTMRSLRRAALPPLQVASHLLLVRAHEASVSSHVLAQLLQCGAVG